MSPNKTPKKIKRKPGANIDWTDIEPLFGKLSDAEIGRMHGIKPHTVSSARRAREIPSVDRFSMKKVTHKIDWDNEPRLGKMPDRLLQRYLGVASCSSVTTARRRRGIPKYQRPDRDALLLAFWDIKSLVEDRQDSIDREVLEAIFKRHKLFQKEKKK